MANITSADWLSWPLRIGDHVNTQPVFFARALGTAGGDLDIDFYVSSRPVLVTEILKNMLYTGDGATYPDDILLQWTLHKRLQGLLAATTISCGQNADLTIRCANAACLKPVDIDIDFLAFANTNDVRSFEWSAAEGINLLIDLPTGEDQYQWSEAEVLRDRDMQKKIATSLVRKINGNTPTPDWQISDEWLASLSEEFERQDPLTALKLTTNCPECSQQIDVDFDLEGMLLQKLKLKQKIVFEQIHHLASAYHWSEKEIIEMPSWRRAYYLAQLGVED